MRKLWVPLFVLLLLPASYSEQRPAERMETAQPPLEDSIAHQTQDPGETTLYFPDYVDGGGWSVQLVLSNVDPVEAAEFRVEVYDPEGRPVPDLFDSDLTLEVPALGSRVLRSSGMGAIRRGWIQVRAGTDSVSGLLTYRHARSGIEVGVKPVELGPQFALFVEESPTVGAGVAVYKPEVSPHLELRIRGEEGNDPLEGEIVSWGDFHQAARTLPEWFAVEGIDTGFLGDFRGLLFLETGDESLFAPLGLRFGKGTSSLSAVPAIRTQSEEPQETNLVFPDYVDGGGWSVQLVLSNVDPAAAAEAVVEVYDPEGQPVPDLFDSDLTLEVPALGSRVLRSTGSGAIRRGWIQVEADAGTISGLLTYRHTESGVEVGVEPARLGKQFALFVEESGTVGAGLALFKPAAESRIELRLRDEEGDDPLNGLFLPWKDFHQSALTLPEWFDVPGVDAEFLTDFRGLLFLRTEDESRFAPLGLRFGKGTSSLSAVPVIQLPDGGGIEGGQAPPPTVKLSVSPAAIERGQSTMLTWSSTSAESAKITPGIGEVPAAGSRKVSPRTTTTYHITVRGARGQTRTASVTVTVRVGGSQQAVLTALYESTGGPDWFDSSNWGTDQPLRDWHGITVDDGGRVTDLDLSRNGLTGPIPPELGNLTSLESLNLGWNGFTGPIPPELGNLTHLGSLSLYSNDLTGPIPPELGNLTSLRVLNLSSNDLTGPIPPELSDLKSLRELLLRSNGLTGPIPPALANLTSLESLNLGWNDLTGPIPPELGGLTSLTELNLNRNGLTGPIPPELGDLTSLTELNLSSNALTGPIPFELGNLTSLESLNLGWNDLTGPIPPELGGLTSLESLNLGWNDLTGPIPPELGDLTSLTELDLWGNSGLAGILPTELTGLGRLETLWIIGTDLCAPSDPGFQDWLGGIYRLRVATCVSDSAAFAYLTQAVQSREYPVPLVAGEKALLRVFVTAGSPTTAGIPPVRARFYEDGTEIHVADIPARTASLPTEVYEGDLSRSSNAEVPGEIIRPGLEMVVEIDPEGTLDPGLVTASRIPDTGRMAVDVREMPVLHLTVVPFLWSDDPHRGAVETAEAMEADPEGHELLWETRTLLPIGDLEVTAHAPVMTSTSPDGFQPLLGETEAIRAMEGGSGHYMGTISSPGYVTPSGLAFRPGRVFISRLNPKTMAHELGHNLSLDHAPCGGAWGPDPAFPSPNGSTGAWGYDFRYGGALASPYRPDLMSYCEPAGISDYHFANALRFRLVDEGPPGAVSLIAQDEGPFRPARLISQEAKSLLLWGGMDAEGQLFLNPSFAVDAPAALPRATGEHRITGQSGSGDELFSVGFTMPEVADGDGSSSFAFVLPVEPGWAVRLASITLSGPGGSVTLDSDTDTPLFILVDPSTGQVRGILRDPPQADASALVSQAGTDRLEVLFSRGIPDAAAWGQRRILDVKGIGGGQAPPPSLMLSAAPSAIDWGEDATLKWSSTHAESVEITPALGAVPLSGSRKVSPRTTTTYHITVRGAGGQTRTASVTVTVVDSQRDVLTALYQSTGGPDWFDSSNWGTSQPLRDWHGITVDDDGRVTVLDLRRNGLTGPIPPELGNLTSLTDLNLAFNGLTGPIPPELGNLTSLKQLNLRWNGLTGPIPPELGNLTSLGNLRLHYNRLTGPIPPELGNLTSLRYLILSDNGLTGPIPPELGSLTNLTGLNLNRNGLTGPIPPELGDLTSMTELDLNRNGLTGPIPPELGDLTSLTELNLSSNALTGPIPFELGNLTSLESLNLGWNDLTGPIPPELGGLTSLESLNLGWNDLTGPIPPELGDLTSLTELDLWGNSGLAGILPTELTGLGRLETLWIIGTDLCAPSDPGFQDWLGGIYRLRVATCVSDSAAFAYLTQAVQSREYPVPLVAGEKALLRVFVTAGSPTTAGIPPVRARFYEDGTEIHVADIPARTASLPTEVYEGDLSRSSNAEVPGEIIRPGP